VLKKHDSSDTRYDLILFKPLQGFWDEGMFFPSVCLTTDHLHVSRTERETKPFSSSPHSTGVTWEHCPQGDTGNAGRRPTTVLHPLPSLPTRTLTVSSNCRNVGFDTYPLHIYHKVTVFCMGCSVAISYLSGQSLSIQAAFELNVHPSLDAGG